MHAGNMIKIKVSKCKAFFFSLFNHDENSVESRGCVALVAKRDDKIQSSKGRFDIDVYPMRNKPNSFL